MALGPVQLLLVGFDRPDFRGDVLAELERLRESDTVRVLDLLVVHKDAGGNIERLERPDLSGGDLITALIGLDAPGAAANGDELWSLEDAIPNDSAAAIALIEHRWAIGVRSALNAAGGVPVADVWIHPSDLAAAGLIDAESATQPAG
jgi:hypothetical protein